MQYETIRAAICDDEEFFGMKERRRLKNLWVNREKREIYSEHRFYYNIKRTKNNIFF